MPVPRPILLIAVAVAAGLAGCSSTSDDPVSLPEPGVASSAPAPEAPAEVVIQTFSFTPDPITVPVGTTITFENADATTHTVTAGTREAPQPGVIDASLDQGDSVTWTVSEAGTIDYYCRLHSGPGMTGTIVVE